MRPCSRHRAWGLALVLLASRALAHTTSSIAGRVLDPAGQPVPGASIEARDAKGKLWIAVSKADGAYRLEQIPPGLYEVVFRLGKLQPVTRPGVDVKLEAETRLDATLALTSASEVVVTGRRALKDLAAVGEYADSLVGIADSAAEGTITYKKLENRPVRRVGELLETVPGVVISQHSGEGKANQYYLRGFNLDHGTDLATWVGGVPVNMPTHGHGQGYTDTNFLIPELVTSVQYRKGSYSAEEGDFSAAGAVRVNLARRLDSALVHLEGGRFGFVRLLAADSFRVGGGDLLAAGEFFHNDGPWEKKDDYRKINGLVSWAAGTSRNGFRISAQYYQGRWNATDQIARRGVEEGLYDRFATPDPTDGGHSWRYTLSADWQRSTDDSVTRANAYVLSYGLDLWSNFTYVLGDPDHGDQFQQADRRVVSGANLSQQWASRWGGREVENAIGFALRNDAISRIALFHTEARDRIGTTRDDSVTQTSGALWAQNTIVWTPLFRSIAGLRGDLYSWKVDSSLAENSGTELQGILSPKLSLAFGPFSKTDVYVNAGYGFHSNDGRGTTITVDPTSGGPAEKVTGLVRARTAEVGVRSNAIPHLETTVAVWGLDLASELLFVGDAGTTEAGRPSRRYGVEWTNAWTPRKGLLVDLDVAFTRSRFTDDAPEGNRIPGALGRVVAAGVSYEHESGFLGNVRVRDLGPRNLLEDGTVTSNSATTVNLRLGWQKPGRLRVAVDFLNLFDSKASDIDYVYRSRLPGEPAEGVADVHFHPLEPFSIRGSIQLGF